MAPRVLPHLLWVAFGCATVSCAQLESAVSAIFPAKKDQVQPSSEIQPVRTADQRSKKVERTAPTSAKRAGLSSPISKTAPTLVAPPPPAKSAQIPEKPKLLALQKEVWVYQRPHFRSRKIGYLRGGSTVVRSAKAVGYGICTKGWYKVEPQGYVCVGKHATLNLEHPIATLGNHAPDRSQGLPYDYAISRYPTPPMYARLPTAAEQRKIEGEFFKNSKQMPSLWGTAQPVPEPLLNHQVAPSLTPHARGQLLSMGRAVPKSGFGLLAKMEVDGRWFGLNTDFQLLPLDRMRPVHPSSFRGIQLGKEGLPLAFVRSKAQIYYRLDPKTQQILPDTPIGYREVVLLSGKRDVLHGQAFLETRDGRWVRSTKNVVKVRPLRNFPTWAKEGKRWIDISILTQTLVAYEGTKPVFATMVSTGADGLGDPEKTHSTIQGTFLIHTKHVTVTMDSEDEEDRFDLRDVPYVQYFHEGFALHGAYWHDDFGKPKSHGCVNLHPDDAAWLFGWTDPDVPQGWHGSMSLKKGTLVRVRP
jgi:hypothetical protein